jgi:hypothetical protein
MPNTLQESTKMIYDKVSPATGAEISHRLLNVVVQITEFAV